MSAAEFGLHLESYRRNPWGEQRDSIHTAQIVQAISNYAGKTRKDPVKLSDCVIEFIGDGAPSEPEVDPFSFLKQFNK